jgi:hypothetical protein
MSGTKEQIAWIARVLGVAIDGAASGPPPEPFLPVWTAAKEVADSGIGRLQSALRQEDDPDLAQIAEYGLHHATSGRMNRLTVALREADGDPTPQTLSKLAGAISDFRDFLDGAPIVRLMEDNPFGVAVDLRATLGAALTKIESALAF